jgi:hypothetical protein
MCLYMAISLSNDRPGSFRTGTMAIVLPTRPDAAGLHAAAPPKTGSIEAGERRSLRPCRRPTFAAGSLELPEHLPSIISHQGSASIG